MVKMHKKLLIGYVDIKCYELPACKAAVILIMFIVMPSIDYHNNTHYQLVQLLSFNG